MAAFQAGLIEKHYAEVENMYRQIRGWRHDYHNHISTLKAYMALEEYSKVNNYLDELDDDLTTVDTVIKTGNIMVDAILNSKISLAGSKKIEIKAKASVPESIRITDVDICVIVGNLLDNAIEACDNITDNSEKFIRIYIGMKNTQLYMCFTNTAPEGKLSKVDGRFRSFKGKNHGFGLERVDKIIEKYSGYISRNSEDGAFTTEVLLPL